MKFFKGNTMAWVLVMFLMFWAGHAMAYNAGTDFYVNNFYDHRTYDASHPDATIQNHLGGWQVGLSIINPTMATEISHVQINGHNGDSENPITTLLVNTPDVYGWLGNMTEDYAIFIGAKFMVYDTYDIAIFKHDGSMMTVNWNGNETDWMTVMPGKNNAQPPICEIKKMAIMKSGELKMRFTAPYDLNANQIRVRVFAANGDLAYEQKVDQPFEIVKKDGTIIPDKVKVFLPAEYIGLTGRIEYRTKGTDGFGWEGYMLRGITYFKLPELEVE